MKLRGQAVERIMVNVKNKNASIISANAFITKTMNQLFKEKQPQGFTKVFRVTYKLSGGQWFSTKPFEKSAKPEFYHPDLRDDFYNVNHNDELVEHININFVNVKNDEVNTITKYFS